MAQPYDLSGIASHGWPDWLKYGHSPLIHAFCYDGCGFLWDYNKYQGLYVVLPQYPPLRRVS